MESFSQNDDNSDCFKNCNTLVTSNYKYDLYFPIIRKKCGTIKLEFKVKAESDGHILLSETNHTDFGSPVYEIVLGAGRNTFSTIRRKRLRKDKVSVEFEDEYLVSPKEWRGFWIKVFIDGTIEVGREDYEVGFMRWKDPKPLLIKYFSFSCWLDLTAKWIFPCFKDNNI